MIIVSIFDFSEELKNDEIIKEYTSHSEKIYTKIIMTSNATQTYDFSLLGPFPLLVATRDGNIDMIQNFTLGRINTLTNKTSNSKVIVGLFSKEMAFEVKDFAKEVLLNR